MGCHLSLFGFLLLHWMLFLHPPAQNPFVSVEKKKHTTTCSNCLTSALFFFVNATANCKTQVTQICVTGFSFFCSRSLKQGIVWLADNEGWLPINVYTQMKRKGSVADIYTRSQDTKNINIHTDKHRPTCGQFHQEFWHVCWSSVFISSDVESVTLRERERKTKMKIITANTVQSLILISHFTQHSSINVFFLTIHGSWIWSTNQTKQNITPSHHETVQFTEFKHTHTNTHKQSACFHIQTETRVQRTKRVPLSSLYLY